MMERAAFPKPRACALGLVLSLGAGACKNLEPQPDGAAASAAPARSASPQNAKATRVEVAVIQPSEARLDLTLPGEVEAARDAQLAAALGGYIEKITVKSGDKVNKGQILALVDSATHAARRDQAKVELDAAKVELERVEKMGKALPRAQLDAAQARYDGAKAAYRTANVQASRSVITAPFSGVVAEVHVEVGEVAPMGAPLIRVVELDPIKVTVSLSDRDVMVLSEGMKAFVRADGRATVIEGTVTHIHPAANTNTRSFIAEVEVDNAERRLLPGMIASVQVQSEVEGSSLVIAQDWLVTRPNELGVFIHRDGVARWRTVQVGPVVRDSAIINEGLAAGDEIVINGHRELADGDPLLVARRGLCCRGGRAVFDTQASADAGPAAPAGSAKPSVGADRPAAVKPSGG